MYTRTVPNRWCKGCIPNHRTVDTVYTIHTSGCYTQSPRAVSPNVCLWMLLVDVSPNVTSGCFTESPRTQPPRAQWMFHPITTRCFTQCFSPNVCLDVTPNHHARILITLDAIEKSVVAALSVRRLVGAQEPCCQGACWSSHDSSAGLHVHVLDADPARPRSFCAVAFSFWRARAGRARA